MTTLLQVENLSKTFKERHSFLRDYSLSAVKNINFSLEKKKTLAIIGNNGAGKSTLTKMIVGITEPTSGNILFKGKPLQFGDYNFRSKHIRMIFQDPNTSFDPKLNIGQILDAPLKLATELDEEQRNDKIFNTLRLVGLYPDHANIKIRTLSLSQKQRVALARALILEPEVIIADDIIGTLDSSVKTQLTNLMLEVQEKLGIAYIYVGQHLGIIKHIADDILVMDNGEMIEYGNVKSVFTNPQQDLTQRMIESYFGQTLTEENWA
ncbi:MAG: ATP-binding cassette domain-containing protein [Lonepinella koalarum]|nr:ATP-binding cassette domain-containing protein [Lonepinella koalarum]